MALLELDAISVRFGGIHALQDLSFGVAANQVCSLIGPNGAGKTSVFNVVSRIYQPTAGRLWFDGVDLLGQRPSDIAGLGIARTFQELALFPSMTVLENVMAGAYAAGGAGFVRSLVQPSLPTTDRDLAAEAQSLLAALGLQELGPRPVTGLPYGTLKRIELARALALRPKLLLLDEPASGLTHTEVAELALLINRVRDTFDLTVLLVEHHMGLVMQVSDKVVVIELGTKISEGSPREVREDDRVVAAYLGSAG